MSNFFIDTRELRSFRFKYHTGEINLILKNKTLNVGICVTNSFTPNERQDWRQNTINKELIITAIPNQIGRFLFNDKDKLWSNVRNLLKGQIYLIKSKPNKVLQFEVLKQFLSLKKFYLRLLFSKDQLYRADTIITRSSVVLTEKAALIHLITFLKFQINNVIYLNTIPKIVTDTK